MAGSFLLLSALPALTYYLWICINDFGGALVTSGWWGIARHLNYFGDLLMALAWCLPAGFEHPLPYFYFVYMAILLIHRESRDNARCRGKYGNDWDAYCRKVRWRIVPGIY